MRPEFIPRTPPTPSRSLPVLAGSWFSQEPSGPGLNFFKRKDSPVPVQVIFSKIKTLQFWCKVRFS